jgi:hypothetical protein
MVEAAYLSRPYASCDSAQALSERGKYERAGERLREAYWQTVALAGRTLRGQFLKRRRAGAFMGSLLSSHQLGWHYDQRPFEAGIHRHTWEKLCEHNPYWHEVEWVTVHRYPLLSPRSVIQCKLIVWSDETHYDFALPNSEMEKLAQLKSLLEDELPDAPGKLRPTFGGMFLHPYVLQMLLGDCDGDPGFMLPLRGKRGPEFRPYEALPPYAENPEVPVTAAGGVDLRIPFEEGDQVTPLSQWITAMFQKKCWKKLSETVNPSQYYVAERAGVGQIGIFTYALRHKMKQMRDEGMTWSEAVRNTLAKYYTLAEQLFDSRKDSATVEAMRFIAENERKLRKDLEAGDPFSVLACSSSSQQIDQLLKDYPSAESLFEAMFGLSPKRTLMPIQELESATLLDDVEIPTIEFSEFSSEEE